MPTARSASLVKGGLLAAAAGLFAIYAAGFSLRYNERYLDGGIEGGVYRGDGIVRLHAVFKKVAEGDALELGDADTAAIRETLRERPLNAQALAIIGLGAISASGSDQAGSRLMALADKVSRREPLSQVWLIEAASTSGDVREAIRHYNAALSVKPELSPSLFPVLTNALDFAEVRGALRPLILRGAPWLPSFVTSASTSANLDSLLALVLPVSEKLKDGAYGQANATIIYRLAAEGRQADAINYAKSVMQGFSEFEFAKFGVTGFTQDERLGNLSWRLTDGETITASADATGEVSADIQPAAQGPIMARDVMVAAGRQYEFMQDVQRNSGPPLASLRWQATCPAVYGGKIIWSQIVPTDERTMKYKSAFFVPSNCHVLRAELLVVGPDGQLPSSIKVSGLSLAPN
jgi:hypothetical protein